MTRPYAEPPGKANYVDMSLSCTISQHYRQVQLRSAKQSPLGTMVLAGTKWSLQRLLQPYAVLWAETK